MDSFIDAIEGGNITDVKKVYEENDVDLTDDEYNDAILTAIEGGFPHIVEFLLQHGVSANFDVDEKCTGLLYAVTCECEDGKKESIVEVLMSYGADVNAKDGVALNEAVWNESVNIVRVLLSKNTVSSAVKNEALFDAATTANYDIMKLLCDNGADPRAFNDGAITNCAGYDNIACIHLLVQKGADPTEGLVHAVHHNREDVVRYLLTAGANVAIDDDEALWQAVKWNKINIARILLSHGAHVNARNGVFLKQAAGSGYACMVSTLLEFGATVNVNDPCILAAAGRFPQIRSLLLPYLTKAETDTEIMPAHFMPIQSHLYETFSLSQNTTCPVCLDNITSENVRLRVPCQHVFCSTCTHKIINIPCPVCRRD